MDLNARIEELEDELYTVRAEAESASINAEHASQSMDQRYAMLAEEQGRLAANSARIEIEREQLAQELQASKSEAHGLHTSLLDRDAALQRKDVEIEALRADKRGLAKVAEQRQGEVDELHERLKASMDKIVALTDSNTEIGVECRVARSAANRAELERSRIEREKDIAGNRAEWLDQELARKSEILQSERRAASTQVSELRHKLADAEADAAHMRDAQKRLRERCDAAEAAAEESHRALRTAKEEAAAAAQASEGELATVRRLLELHQATSQERQRKVTELEGIVCEFRALVQKLNSEREDAVQKAVAAKEEAEERLEEERALRDRLIQAAAAGELPRHSAEDGAPPAASPGDESGEPVSLTPTEAFTRFVEMKALYQKEKAATRRNEIMLDQLAVHMETKLMEIHQEKVEHSRIKEAYSSLEHSLQGADNQKKELESRLSQCHANCARERRERSAMQQQTKDLSRQVVVLIGEVQRLKTGRSAPRPAANSGGGVQDAQAVISAHLVDVKDIQDLQAKNAQLLMVSRQLGSDAERDKAVLREELEGEAAARVERLAEQLAQHRSDREQQEELMSTLVRQRDMFRQLFEQLSNRKGEDTGKEIQQTPSSSTSPKEESNYKQLHEDLEGELQRVRDEAAEYAATLSGDKRAAQEAASAARSEAARSRADSEFERERCNRLLDQQTESRKQAEEMLMRNGKYQAMVTDLQARLNDARAAAEEGADAARRESHKAQGLEAEKSLLAAAEQRASASAEEYYKERCRVAAELEALKSIQAAKDEQSAKEADRLGEELRRLQREWCDAQQAVDGERRRANDATAAKDHLMESTTTKMEKLTAEVKAAREAQSEAQQTAAAASAKADVLQQAVAQAEERNATLEMQASSRPATNMESIGGDGGTPPQAREATLAGEVRLLRDEVAAAQEAAATAAGNAKQFQALAQSSDQALATMQAQHAQFKQEAESRIAAGSAQEQDLRAQLDEAQRNAASAQRSQRDAAAALRTAEEHLAAERSRAQAASVQAAAEIDAIKLRLQRQSADIENTRAQVRNAEQRRQREVLEHGDTIRKLNAVEALATAASEETRQARAAADASAASMAQSAKEAAEERARLQTVAEAATAEQKQLTHQNTLLHQQLQRMSEAAASGDVPSAGSEMAEVVAYLRREKETLQIQADLAALEAARWRSQAAHAERATAEARQALDAEADRSRGVTLAEAEHKALTAQLTDLAVLRESNTTLRSDCQRHVAELTQTRRRLIAVQEAHRPLQAQIHRLTAEKEAGEAEVALVREEATRWEGRVNELLLKYASVDLTEYTRVSDKLKEAEVQLAALQEVEARLTERSAKVDELTQRLASEKAALAEKSVGFNRVKKMALDYQKICNPDKKKIEEARRDYINRTARLDALEMNAQATPVTQQEMTALRASNQALRGDLQTAQTQLEEAQSQCKKMEEQLNKAREVMKAAGDKFREKMTDIRKKLATASAENSELLSQGSFLRDRIRALEAENEAVLIDLQAARKQAADANSAEQAAQRALASVSAAAAAMRVTPQSKAPRPVPAPRPSTAIRPAASDSVRATYRQPVSDRLSRAAPPQSPSPSAATAGAGAASSFPLSLARRSISRPKSQPASGSLVSRPTTIHLPTQQAPVSALKSGGEEAEQAAAAAAEANVAAEEPPELPAPGASSSMAQDPASVPDTGATSIQDLRSAALAQRLGQMPTSGPAPQQPRAAEPHNEDDREEVEAGEVQMDASLTSLPVEKHRASSATRKRRSEPPPVEVIKELAPAKRSRLSNDAAPHGVRLPSATAGDMEDADMAPPAAAGDTVPASAVPAPNGTHDVDALRATPSASAIDASLPVTAASPMMGDTFRGGPSSAAIQGTIEGAALDPAALPSSQADGDPSEAPAPSNTGATDPPGSSPYEAQMGIDTATVSPTNSAATELGAQYEDLEGEDEDSENEASGPPPSSPPGDAWNTASAPADDGGEEDETTRHATDVSLEAQAEMGAGEAMSPNGDPTDADMAQSDSSSDGEDNMHSQQEGEQQDADMDELEDTLEVYGRDPASEFASPVAADDAVEDDGEQATFTEEVDPSGGDDRMEDAQEYGEHGGDTEPPFSPPGPHPRQQTEGQNGQHPSSQQRTEQQAAAVEAAAQFLTQTASDPELRQLEDEPDAVHRSSSRAAPAAPPVVSAADSIGAANDEQAPETDDDADWLATGEDEGEGNEEELAAADQSVDLEAALLSAAAPQPPGHPASEAISDGNDEDLATGEHRKDADTTGTNVEAATSLPPSIPPTPAASSAAGVSETSQSRPSPSAGRSAVGSQPAEAEETGSQPRQRRPKPKPIVFAPKPKTQPKALGEEANSAGAVSPATRPPRGAHAAAPPRHATGALLRRHLPAATGPLTTQPTGSSSSPSSSQPGGPGRGRGTPNPRVARGGRGTSAPGGNVPTTPPPPQQPPSNNNNS